MIRVKSSIPWDLVRVSAVRIYDLHRHSEVTLGRLVDKRDHDSHIFREEQVFHLVAIALLARRVIRCNYGKRP
jgi:hypothetical protein